MLVHEDRFHMNQARDCLALVRCVWGLRIHLHRLAAYRLHVPMLHVSGGVHATLPSHGPMSAMGEVQNICRHWLLLGHALGGEPPHEPPGVSTATGAHELPAQ